MSARLLADEFVTQVGLSPDRLALVLESGQRYTYQELHSIAVNIGACVLAGINTHYRSSEDTPLVCLMMHRHAGLIASILGVILAGAAYVPVDPTFPIDRQSYIFEHSKCQLLIVDEDTCRQSLSLNMKPLPVIVISSDGALISHPCLLHHPGDTLHNARQACHSRHMGGLMYVLYTSGSTGKPKGVMVQQYGVSNVVSWFANEIGINQNSKVLGLTTACFDISVLEIFMPLIKGGTLILADSASQRDPFRLLELIRKESIGVFQATPTTYEMMLATGWRGDRSIDFIVGGEAFRPSLLQLARESRSLRNVYGPTETSIWSSSFLVSGNDLERPSYSSSPVVPVGKPIGNTTFYLIDIKAANEGVVRLVNQGEEGELWIGGIGVARGYLHQPELSKRCFLTCPFEENTVYRTGDVMRQLKCGNYVFVRRLDDQVKINGFRIELAEIENTYSQHPFVEQAVVVVRHGKLSAYLKPSSGIDMSNHRLSEVSSLISRSLPSYMVPAFVTIVNRFPQTANGKLDRNALPDPKQSSKLENQPKDAVGEESEEEYTMFGHVQRIIEQQRGTKVRSSNTFAAIGMDSLGAVLFVRALSDSLGGVPIKTAQIFRAGVTVYSFSEDLYLQILESQPAVLTELNIHPCNQGSSIDKIATVEDSIEHYEAYLSNHLASNIRFFQGVRGAYTIIGIIPLNWMRKSNLIYEFQCSGIITTAFLSRILISFFAMCRYL